MNPNNNQWVYYNGELYHAGVKGMHWYQHLPGTDWWKNVGTTVKNVYKSNMQKNSPFEYDTKKNAIVQKKSLVGAAKSAFAAAKTGARMIRDKGRRYFREESAYYKNKAVNAVKKSKAAVSKYWNTAKGYSQEQINKFKESAHAHYNNVRAQVSSYMDSYLSRTSEKYMRSLGIKGSDDVNHLASYIDDKFSNLMDSYNDKNVKGIDKFLRTLNTNISIGLSTYLDKIGMDDEVAKFMKKFKIMK